MPNYIPASQITSTQLKTALDWTLIALEEKKDTMAPPHNKLNKTPKCIYCLHYMTPENQGVLIPPNDPRYADAKANGMPAGDVFICVSCFSIKGKCEICKTHVSASLFNPWKTSSSACTDCTVSEPLIRLNVKQHEKFTPKSNIVRERSHRWNS